MGLAASQAKLLSITSRLSDNELRSQSITAAKMALANQTSAASEKYINALGTNEFIYRTYDDNGNQVYTALTGAQLSTYAPLKNQYALVNTKGQVLVSELDAANYEDSADINEFLEKYGVERIDTGEVRTVVNPGYDEAYEEWREGWEEWKAQEPDKTNPIYWEEGTSSISSELYDKFLYTTAICYSAAIASLAMSLGYLPVDDIVDGSGNTVISFETSGSDNNPTWAHLYDENGTEYAKIGSGEFNKDCYSHVLSHLLNLGDYTTTLGNTITISTNYGSDGAYAHWWARNNINNRADNAEMFANLIDQNNYPCCADSDVDITADTLAAAKGGDNSAIAQILMSDYYYDSTGNVQVKSLQQKIIDLNYGMVENVFSDQQAYDAIQHFVNHDLMVFKEAVDIFKEDEYNEDYEAWLAEEPDPLDVPATIDETIYKYSDKDKAQWYVNLWHRMNGESDEKDGVVTTSSTTTNVEVTSNSTTTTTTTNTYTRNRWDILEDGLMNSQDWLKYALESGTVSLERVNFSNPTEEGTGLQNATWTSIIYSNALDISEQTDDTAIAKAEAEYEQKTREIENKDKQYDSILKLLDTEHTALQTEYDSVKTVINKNTERTLKIYSA